LRNEDQRNDETDLAAGSVARSDERHDREEEDNRQRAQHDVGLRQRPTPADRPAGITREVHEQAPRHKEAQSTGHSPPITTSVSASSTGGLGRIAPGDLAEESNMHTPCQSLPAARKFMEIRCKSFTEKGLRHISTLVALALRPGGVERIAPVPWSLATTSGANRSTPTPQWWHAPFAALTGMASQPVSRPPGPRGRGPRRCRPRVPPGQPGRGAQTAAARQGTFCPGS